MIDDDRRSGFPDSPGSVPPVSAPRYTQRRAMSLPEQVGHAMLSLQKASRSFTLYDPHNDAVKMLIGDFREKSAVLARHAPIEVEVLPFEFVFQNQTVYEEHDRERSLAFRLFRDGVRKIHFEPGLGWDDLVSLLEVMSVRCNGVRQQEEDLITLLRKARFESIVIDSVEGYTPDEEMPENDALAPMVEDADSFDPIPDWDQPVPGPAGGTVQYHPLDPEPIYALLDEESPAALAAQAVRAVYELLQTANTLRDERLRQALVPFVDEVQHYLIVQRDLDELARLAVVYREAFGDGRTLPVLGEERSFERIMRMVTEEDEPVPKAVYHLLGPPSVDMVSRSIDMLTFGTSGARRQALLDVVEHGSRNQPALLVERIGMAPPELAPELFAILGKIAPNARTDAAFALLEHPDPAFQLELLTIVADGSKGIRLARGLQTLLRSPFEEVRIQSALTLGELGGAKAVPMLAEHARTRAHAGMTAEEATAIGRAMAGASVGEAMPVLLEWAQSTGGLRSLLSKIRKDALGSRPLMIAAVAGLERCPGKQSETALRSLLSRACDDPELADRCQSAVERQRGGSDDE